MKCICKEPLFAAKLAKWKKQNDRQDTGRSTIERIVLNALSNPKNTAAVTAQNESRILRSTMPPISTRTKRRMSKKLSGGERCGSDTQQTQTFENSKNERPTSTESESRLSGSLEQCGHSDRLWKSLFALLPSGVESAEPTKAETQEAIACISTTITTRANSEDCCALAAILGSESFAMIASA